MNAAPGAHFGCPDVARHRGAMSARIVMIHGDPEVINQVVPVITRAGYDVAAFTNSTEAWDVLKSSQPLDLVITQVSFPPGMPHGISLARRARAEHPDSSVLFIGPKEMSEHISGLGTLIPPTLEAAFIAQTVEQLLNKQFPLHAIAV